MTDECKKGYCEHIVKNVNIFKKNNACNRGFTITELLVAITIFSLIMVAASAGIIQVGRMYYKTIVVSQTQSANRAVVDEISRALQFSGSRPEIIRDGSGQIVRLCVGSTRFTIGLDDQGVLGQDAGAYAILRDQAESGGCPIMPSPIPSNDSTELLIDNTRFTDFDVRRIGSTDNYVVETRVLYGEEEVTEIIQDDSGNDIRVCRVGTAGVELCAVSLSETTITRRLTGE